MTKLAMAMLAHRKSRLIVAIAGVAVSFFLISAQIGLLIGWCNTTSALVLHSKADVWVMATQTPAYDYGTAIPRNRIYEVRSVEGVSWAQGLFVGWNVWQRPDGRRVYIEVIGMDGDLVGGPWRFDNGNVESVRRPDTVIVDSLYLSMLGVHQIGDEVEVFGKRARLGAVSSGVRTFTALPFVFTSMRSAVRYDQRYRDDETTYVLARCEPGTTSEQLRDKIKAAVPQVEVLTSREFAIRTVRYWMLGTGMGITVIVTATLGLIVGTVIISQTLYAITQDHLNDYAALLAIGFSHRKLVGTIGLQALGMGICGTAIGAVLFAIAARATASSPIPLEMTAQIFPIICAVSLACCIAASFLSVRAIFKLDPVQVFRA